MPESKIQKEIRQSKPFESAFQEAGIALLRTSDQLQRRLAAAVEPQGITVQQYNEQYRPAVTGSPALYAHDGFAAVFLWPEPAGQVITLQTRSTVSEFADQTTDYTLPDGWANALGAALAVRIAPNILGQLPQSLVRAEEKALGAVDKYEPAIIDGPSFQSTGSVYPRRLF